MLASKRVISSGLRDYWEKCCAKSQQWREDEREIRRSAETVEERGKRRYGGDFVKRWGPSRWYPTMMERGGERGAVGTVRMPAVVSRGALGGGWWQRSPRTAGGLLGRTRNLTTNGHATSGEPSLPASLGIHYLLVPCQPPHRHSYLILIYYLPRSVPL